MAKREGLVLVSGATGQQGGSIARELLDADWRVRAMTRKPESEAAQALARSDTAGEPFGFGFAVTVGHA